VPGFKALLVVVALLGVSLSGVAAFVIGSNSSASGVVTILDREELSHLSFHAKRRQSKTDGRGSQPDGSDAGSGGSLDPETGQQVEDTEEQPLETPDEQPADLAPPKSEPPSEGGGDSSSGDTQTAHGQIYE